MGKKLEVAVNLCVIGACLFLAYERFSKTSDSKSKRVGPVPVADSLWLAATSAPPLRGSSGGNLKVVIVTDVQCPFCREFEATLAEFNKRKGNTVAQYLVHLPLPQHPFSKMGASAIECARPFGRGDKVYEFLLAAQDSLPLYAIEKIASSSGIQDSRSFKRCVEAGQDSLLEAHESIVRGLGVVGTPTVIVNGYLWKQPPSLSQLLEEYN
jgi:protein-disulfide isomerase